MPTDRDLAGATWPEIDSPTVIVPVGSLEQHGPHLPLDTDTRIATAVANDLAVRSGGAAVVAPPIAYGASGEHEGFAGTISIGHDVLEQVVVEYGRSACRWACRILFVNGHGGNGRALVKSVSLLRYEGRDAAWLPCVFPGADAHAGRTETSLLLQISPGRMRPDKAERGNVTPIAELMPSLREGGTLSVSANGVLGDPAGASAEEGALLLESAIERAVDAVARWKPDADGRLR